MKRRATVYWLMPAAPERELFRALIRILAKELKAPVFEPHLTLFVTETDSPAAKQTLEQVKAVPVSLSIRDVRSSREFTKTLFIRFQPNAALNALAADLQGKAGSRVVKVSEPHLSLCYKDLSAKTRRELASIVRLPRRKIRFDAVKAVRCAVPTRTAAEVRAWRALARKHL
jgi:2'-5' RNA ligase